MPDRNFSLTSQRQVENEGMSKGTLLIMVEDEGN